MVLVTGVVAEQLKVDGAIVMLPDLEFMFM
jgi:hypothetical protein